MLLLTAQTAVFQPGHSRHFLLLGLAQFIGFFGLTQLEKLKQLNELNELK
jgi:hypothetical protein